MTDTDTVTLTFTKAQLTLLNAALQELAFKHAAPLITDINRQIAEQKRDDDGKPSLTVVPSEATS